MVINEVVCSFRARIDHICILTINFKTGDYSVYFSKRDNNTHVRSISIKKIVGIDSFQNINLYLRQYSGRFGFHITQQPTKSNGYKAIVRVYDDKSNAAEYSIELFVGSYAVA